MILFFVRKYMDMGILYSHTGRLRLESEQSDRHEREIGRKICSVYNCDSFVKGEFEMLHTALPYEKRVIWHFCKPFCSVSAQISYLKKQEPFVDTVFKLQLKFQ